ncbi:MAG: penicillin-binding protein [Novosphingobium sp.]|nr:penicillin-binding protein [Novosphingobium sp.]MBO9600940.1 penicillin-binding protein [Novosphingobium sp.]
MASVSRPPGLLSRLFRRKPEPQPPRHIDYEESWLSPLYDRDEDDRDFAPQPDPRQPHLYPPFAVAGETLPLPPAPQKRTRWWWISRGVAALLFLFILTVGWLLVTAPLSKSLQPIAPPEITLLAADGTPIARNGAVVAAPVEVKKLPPHVVDAFIAIEDRRFYSHWGIDPRGIARAVWSNITRGKTEGGSTITQQLAKFTFLSPEQNLGRKAREALIALWLEAWLTKDQILERYLSNAYFGDNCYGLRAASLHYFYRQPEKLRPEQAAMLAGMLKAPSSYAPTQHPQAAERRMRVVLRTMVETGYLTQAEVDKLPTPRVDVRETGDDLPTGTYFADWALPQARRLSEVSYQRQTITTTLDSRLQAAARRAIERAPLGKAQVALVAMRPNGEVVAMIGGKDYEKSPFNRATQAQRQPGSTFKLFVYLAALEKGWRPSDTIDNTAITTGSYRPANASGNYSPTITLEDAFARSSNVAAVRLFRDVGDASVIRVARKLGVTSPLAEGDPSLALGTSTMNLMELTAAYAGVAANSFPVQPRAFTADKPGWFDWLWSSKSSLSSREHDDIEELLRGVVNRGTGRSARLGVANFGKTGTTQDNRDALFIGYAGDLVVGVWIGNDDNSPLGDVHGGSVPARIWRDFMVQALGGKAAPAPARPSPSPNPSGPIQPLDIPNLDDLPIGDTKLNVDPQGASISTSINGNPVDVRIDQNGVRIEPSPKPSAKPSVAASGAGP